jgi:putative transposase
MAAEAQLKLRLRSTWGGRREGAGRPRLARRKSVPHRSRPEHKEYHPVHLTLRAVKGLPSFRAKRVYRGIEQAIAAASRDEFQIVHFSVQGNHMHLFVEADDTCALARGAKGLAIRTARAINKRLGRKGRVWGDRYHTRALTTPREVRNALIYILFNVKKHNPSWRGLDPCSSAAWFDGFRGASRASSHDPTPVRPARTWLATAGWRRHGLIAISEAPRPPT